MAPAFLKSIPYLSLGSDWHTCCGNVEGALVMAISLALLKKTAFERFLLVQEAIRAGFLLTL
jgi:hypothetical protein